MEEQTKNLLKRGLTGSLFIGIILSGIFAGTIAYSLVFGLLTYLCLFEFYSLVNKTEGVKVRVALNAGAGLYLFFFVLILFDKEVHATVPYLPLLLLPYLVYLISLFITGLYQKKGLPILTWAYSVLGQAYIAVSLACLNALAFGSSYLGGTDRLAFSPVLVLALFIFIWTNDTGAYLVGVKWGKRRLFERISPKKSWEGFWGGAVLTMLASLIFSYYQTDLPYWHWLILAITVVVFGTLGDLAESLLKRNIGVKDSGKILPGHGGILDRVDGVLLAAPALTIVHYFLLLLQ